jgi:hypothetical protein
VGSSCASSAVEAGRRARRAIDAALVLALLLAGMRFVRTGWRWNEAPDAARALAAIARGGPSRFDDGIGVPGYTYAIARAWAAALPPGACVAVDGPWEVARTARYYLYPRSVYNHLDAALAADDRAVTAIALWPPRPLADPRFAPAGPGLFVRRAGAGEAAGALAAAPLEAPFGAATLAGVLAAIGAVAAIGAGVRRAAFPGAGATAAGRAGFAWLLGTAVVAVASIAASWAGARLRVGFYATLVAATLAAALLRRLLRGRRGPEGRTPVRAAADAPAGRAASLAAGAAIGVIVLQVAVGAALALGTAPTSGDDLSEWALKAKHYYAAQASALPGEPHEAAFLFRNYPPLVPALLALVYRAAGGIADIPGKLVFAGFLAALFAVLFDALRAAGVSRLRALGVTALLAMGGNELVNEAGYAWADLPLAAFALAGTAAAAGGAPLLAGALAGAAALTKLEGAPTGLAVVAAAVMAAPRGGRCAALLRAGPAFAAAAGLWFAWCAGHGVGASTEHIATFAPARLAVAAPRVLGAALSEYRFAWAFPTVAAGLAIGALRGFPAGARPAAFVFLAAFLLPLGAYVVTSYDGAALIRQIDYTAARLLLHALPVGMLAAGLGALGPPERGGTRDPSP